MVNIHASSVGYSILDFEIGSKIEWEMMLNLLIWGSQTCIHEAQASLLILLVPWERLDSILKSKRKFALHMSKWIREMNTRVWLMRIMSLHLRWRWQSWSQLHLLLRPTWTQALGFGMSSWEWVWERPLSSYTCVLLCDTWIMSQLHPTQSFSPCCHGYILSCILS